MQFFALLFIVPVAMLTGCAVKPPMDDSGYTAAGQMYQAASRCREQGYYTPSTMIAVQQVVVQTANSRWSADPVRLSQALENTYVGTVDREFCSALAEQAGQFRSQQQPAYVQPSNNMPVQTTCNKIGFQTYCTTY